MKLRKTNHKAKVTNWLWVGDVTSCDGLDITVHIYRDDFPHYCEHGHKMTAGSLCIEYKEGEPLTETILNTLDSFIASIMELRKSVPGLEPDVLVHCHAGACRSPIIAAYILSGVEGIDIFDAIALVSRAIAMQRDLAVNITHKPLRSILDHDKPESLRKQKLWKP